jgi:hypothetical protein
MVNVDSGEMKRILDAKLYGSAKLSLGQAAELERVCQRFHWQKSLKIIMYH